MKALPRIAESEWQVMRVLWRTSPLSANEVVDELAPVTKWKPKTVKTLLNRLVHKGALGYSQEGRAYRYYPLVSEKDCVRADSRSFLERVYGGAPAAMLANMLEESHLSKDEIAELRRILDKKEK